MTISSDDIVARLNERIDIGNRILSLPVKSGIEINSAIAAEKNGVIITKI